MNKLRFQKPISHKSYGWYVCTLGGKIQYIHTNHTLHDSTDNGKISTGYFATEQDAMDALVNYLRNHIGDS